MNGVLRALTSVKCLNDELTTLALNSSSKSGLWMIEVLVSSSSPVWAAFPDSECSGAPQLGAEPLSEV